MEKLEFRLLRADEIECRVAQVGKTAKGAWCSILLYKDARCDQRMLDETVGAFSWERRHELINGNLFCTVSIRNGETNEWVSKQDVGTESMTEKEKGQASDAFKRACFNWGLGRELYTAPRIFIALADGEYSESAGKVRVSPRTSFSVNSIEYDDNRRITALVLTDQNGRERYRYGGVVPNTSQPSASVPVDTPKEEDDIKDAFELVKPSIEQAVDIHDLQRVWDGNTNLHAYAPFVAAVSKRKKEVAA